MLSLRQALTGKTSSYRNYNDADLMRLCAGGDQLAWNAVMDRNKHMMYSICRHCGFQPEESKDIIQNVAVSLYENVDKLRIPGEVRLWLKTATIRACLALAAQEGRYLSLELRSADSIEDATDEAGEDQQVREPADPARTQDEILDWAEKQQIIADIMETLQDPCNAMIELRFFEHRSYKDTAARLGLPPDGIGTRLARCLEKFKLLVMARGIQHA